MENQSIICFASDWDSDPTSKHQVMKILSESNKILDNLPVWLTITYNLEAGNE